MDNPRRSVLALMVAILAKEKLAELPRDAAVAWRHVIYHALLDAEAILSSVDCRGPVQRINGQG